MLQIWNEVSMILWLLQPGEYHLSPKNILHKQKPKTKECNAWFFKSWRHERHNVSLFIPCFWLVERQIFKWDRYLISCEGLCRHYKIIYDQIFMSSVIIFYIIFEIFYYLFILNYFIYFFKLSCFDSTIITKNWSIER